MFVFNFTLFDLTENFEAIEFEYFNNIKEDWIGLNVMKHFGTHLFWTPI